MVRVKAVKRRSRGVLHLVCGSVLAATAACSGTSGMGAEISPEGPFTPIAHVDIELSRTAGFESSQAIAHFVYVHEPSQMRGAAPLTAVLTGARSAIPAPGRCQDLTSGSSPTTGPVELLEAGSVIIRTTPTPAALPSRTPVTTLEGAPIILDGAPVPLDDAALLEPEAPADTREPAGADELPDTAPELDVAPEAPTPVTISLAPRAFPGFSSVASGVMYTSRDREIPLPARAEYQVEIEGAGLVPAMSLRGVAPAYLDQVTIGGTPLEQVTHLTVGSPIDITWDIGQSEDLVIVDIAGIHDGRTILRCAYSDAAGSGTVPWVATLNGLLNEPAQAELRIHRLRVVQTTTSTPGSFVGARGELRFDFELTRQVEFR